MLIPPDSGSIILDGNELTNKNPKEIDEVRNSNIGYSFQEPLLIPYLSTVENALITRPAPGYRSPTEEEARMKLTEIGLSHILDYMPSKLSGGERKKVDLVRALLKNPRFLVADEPLSGLDPDSTQTVIHILQGFARNGRSVICSSVNPENTKWVDSTLTL